ncbi:MAG: carbohydrate kinase family protein [Patescibacteria group bacterium]
MSTYDFIAIGDTVTDEFIKLKDARVHCNVNDTDCELCVRFGDKVPFESVETVYAVGNAANAAVSATRLGLTTAFVSDVGGDELGERMLEWLTLHNVHTSFIRVHEDMMSNHHYVLQYEAERTILVKHQPYPYALPDIGEPKWVYLSSLGENSLPYHEEVADYLADHKNIKLAFQPGTFQIKLGAEKLKKLYKHTEVFFCNKEEAQHILGNEEKDIKKLLKGVHDLGPKTVVITDGPKGAHAFEATTGDFWSVPMFPDTKPPVDRTGAGDAFASTIAAALALGEPLEKALLWGPINSEAVVQEIGAQKGLLTREKLEAALTDAPDDYKVEKVS